MIEVVLSAAGGVVLVIVLIVVWLRVRRRRRNDEYPPLVPEGGVVEENVNHFSDPSEGSELTSGRGSASLTKPSSSGSSCSDITVPIKDKKDNLNSKIKKYEEGHC